MGSYRLSVQAASLWGKSDGGEGQAWLPLYLHLLDTVHVAARLWDCWIPEATRRVLTRAWGNDAACARAAVCFVAGVHDLGKATPLFQIKPGVRGPYTAEVDLSSKPRNAGLPLDPHLANRSKPTHAVAGQLLLEVYLTGERGWEDAAARSVASVVGSHHGKPPSPVDLEGGVAAHKTALGAGNPAWDYVRAELIGLVSAAAGLEPNGWNRLAGTSGWSLDAPAASLLAGMVIMADWIASDQDLFPLIPLSAWDEEDGDPQRRPVHRGAPVLCEGAIDGEASRARADAAWSLLDLIPSWRGCRVGDLTPAELYRERFGFGDDRRPRPVQETAVSIARSALDPGLLIVEAPMGEGKTEAALAAAEILAERKGCGGVCVALPTMATTDAMFGRVHAWLERMPCSGGRTMYLAHGKARLNDEFQGIARVGYGRMELCDDDREEGEVAGGVVVSDWMRGRKKGVLANFVVCTVDQVLMGALAMKHLSLRQLALANKVVVIDECHAYDVYMRAYLARVLEWLGAWDVPVILLSATLPECQRAELVEAYRRGKASWGCARRTAGSMRSRLNPRHSGLSCPSDEDGRPDGAALEAPETRTAYPLVTYTDGCETRYEAPMPSGRATDVLLRMMGDDEDELVDLLRTAVGDGGCAGVICSTVARAQRAATALGEAFGEAEVVLTHARFVDLDRMANETRLRTLLGPEATRENGGRPDRLVVVGTQVLEQSLDIDFDVLVSDVAPVDVLMQRLGRLHRHERGSGQCQRPHGLRTATCYVRGVASWGDDGPEFAKGVGAVYEAQRLLETLAIAQLTCCDAAHAVHLPDDIARMVRSVYAGEATMPTDWARRYEAACKQCEQEEGRKRRRAQACLIPSAEEMRRDRRSLSGWFLTSSDRNRASAGRDEDWGPRAVRDTLEGVEVMLLVREGRSVRLLPWLGDPEHGVEPGAEVSVQCEPPPEVAFVAAQSTVRLPPSLTGPRDIEAVIGELEEACGPYQGAWGLSRYMAGSLALLLERDEDGMLTASLRGRRVTYSRARGLEVAKEANDV